MLKLHMTIRSVRIYLGAYNTLEDVWWVEANLPHGMPYIYQPQLFDGVPK
jgi:hypothetical protein